MRRTIVPFVAALALTGGSPILLMGGTFTMTEVGKPSSTFEHPVPPGLVALVTKCSVDGPLDTDAGFHIHAYPAYMLLTG